MPSYFNKNSLLTALAEKALPLTDQKARSASSMELDSSSQQSDSASERSEPSGSVGSDATATTAHEEVEEAQNNGIRPKTAILRQATEPDFTTVQTLTSKNASFVGYVPEIECYLLTYCEKKEHVCMTLSDLMEGSRAKTVGAVMLILRKEECSQVHKQLKLEDVAITKSELQGIMSWCYPMSYIDEDLALAQELFVKEPYNGNNVKESFLYKMVKTYYTSYCSYTRKANCLDRDGGNKKMYDTRSKLANLAAASVLCNIEDVDNTRVLNCNTYKQYANLNLMRSLHKKLNAEDDLVVYCRLTEPNYEIRITDDGVDIV